MCLRTRMRPYRSLAYTLPLLVLVSAGVEGQRRAGSPPLQTVPGTTLRVRLPAGWVVSRGRGPLDGLRYSAGPPYEIAAGQPNPNMQGESCIDMLGALMSLRQLQLRLAARPEFIRLRTDTSSPRAGSSSWRAYRRESGRSASPSR